MSGCFQINSKLVTTTKQLTKQSRQLANKLRRPFLSPTINSVNILTLVFKYKGTISDNPPVKIGANIHSMFIKKKKKRKETNSLSVPQDVKVQKLSETIQV